MKRTVTVRCSCNQYPDFQTPCCDFFKQMLNDCRVRLKYDEKNNTYGILLVGKKGMQPIYYCLWCGKKFPDSIAGKNRTALRKK